eukprot:NODE_217_length_12479_cov_0.651212.p7 type:complete len:216 gc:universal NODE_217_length_12479_cov_0.651212:5327-4680(-)
MRRGVGISGLQSQQKVRAVYAEQGTVIQTKEKEDLEQAFSEFEIQLEDFANKHYNEIAKNPELRAKMTLICNKFNINILAKKNAFHRTIGNFYLQLSVLLIQQLKEHQVIEKSELARQLSELTKQDISLKDVDQCIKSLKPLGDINTIIIQEKEYFCTISLDHVQLLVKKSWNLSEIKEYFNLSELLAQTYLEELIRSGLGWLDAVDGRVYVGIS